MEQAEMLKHIGKPGQDNITGYRGVIVGVTYWMNGCVRVGLQGKLDKDGMVQFPQWFDEQQIVVKEKGGQGKNTGGKEPLGGPTAKPKRRQDPR